MAYDHRLAARIRGVFGNRKGVAEKRMFGGLAFLVGGHMACGVVGEELMVRVGPEAYESALREPHARVMDFTGKPLRGMVYVASEGIATDPDLASWVEQSYRYTVSLPPK